MKHQKKIISLLAIAIITIAFFSFQLTEPWRPNQLIDPKDLATQIENQNSFQPLIISVGPGGLIPGSFEVGPAKEKTNLAKLKLLLTKEKKDREIVIYCGCCPFERCPNIRPAFALLNNLKFTNHKLLNLPHNIKIDWIDKGYPTNN